MADPEDILQNSPADFDSSLAYALHPEMRRLIIVWVVGTLLTPVGIQLFVRADFADLDALVFGLVGLLIAVGGAVLLFGGLVGALFKLVTDASIVAAEYQSRQSDTK